MLARFRHWLFVANKRRRKAKVMRVYGRASAAAKCRGSRTRKVAIIRLEEIEELRLLDDEIAIADSRRLCTPPVTIGCRSQKMMIGRSAAHMGLGT